MNGPPSPLDRLISKLDRSGGDAACWPFIGALKPTGYGNFWPIDRTVGAHVAAYRLFVGPIPTGLEIDHLCHEPQTCVSGSACQHRRCCNWRHLTPVSHRDNDLRGAGVSAVNIRKTHCRNGHVYDLKNVYRAPGSPQDRHCLTCMRARSSKAKMPGRFDVN